MDVKSFFRDSMLQSVEVKSSTIVACSDAVERAVETMVACYRAGGKVLLCGNGGSAADAQHLATELMIRLGHDISRPALGAVSLSCDPSNVTACGNDLGFEQLFARNVEGLGRAGDVLIAISTSGRSPNILHAVRKGREIGMRTIGLTGGSGGDLADEVDVAIVIPSSNTQRIQEAHITIGHVLCESTERILYDGSP